MKGKFIPEIPGENVSCPGEKDPDSDRPEIKFPDPTRPQNILKNVPRPRTGFGPVRSGPVRGNSGFRVAPQVFNCDIFSRIRNFQVRCYDIYVYYAHIIHKLKNVVEEVLNLHFDEIELVVVLKSPHVGKYFDKIFRSNVPSPAVVTHG